MSEYIYKSDDSSIDVLTSPHRSDLFASINYFNVHVEPNVVGWFYLMDHVIIHQIMNNILANVTGDICEIGVAFGKSTVALSNYRREGETLHLFDVFTEEERLVAAGNIAKYGTYNDFEWHITDTTKLTADDLKFGDIRFLHIDGCHEHTAVWKDLTNFSTKMADGGVIVLDDYTDPEYPGVNSGAIQFLLENKDWCIFCIGQNKCYMCKKIYQPSYTMQLLDMVNTIRYAHYVDYQFNRRQVLDTNVLMCCSREDKPLDQLKADLHNEMILR